MKRIKGKFMTAGRQKAYYAWYDARRRCSNKSHQDYKNYGARGIAVCIRWTTFEAFHADMGDAPPGLSLDRKNNDGNYEPSNCRWATPRQQVDNSRLPRMLTHHGRSASVSAWAAEFGITPPAMQHRIRRHGVQKALSMGPRTCLT